MSCFSIELQPEEEKRGGLYVQDRRQSALMLLCQPTCSSSNKRIKWEKNLVINININNSLYEC